MVAAEDVGDRRAGPGQRLGLLRHHAQAEVRRVHDAVVRATEADVGPQRTAFGGLPGQRDAVRPKLEVARRQVRRHVREADLLDDRRSLDAPDRRAGDHQAGGRLESDGCLGCRCREQALLDQAAGEGDDAVAAHRAVALVVHEQHGEVGVGPDGRQEHRAVHVAMAARLEADDLANVIGVLQDPAPALQDRCQRHGRVAGRDEPQRLAACVEVDGLDRQARAHVRLPYGADGTGADRLAAAKVDGGHTPDGGHVPDGCKSGGGGGAADGLGDWSPDGWPFGGGQTRSTPNHRGVPPESMRKTYFPGCQSPSAAFGATVATVAIEGEAAPAARSPDRPLGDGAGLAEAAP